METVKEAPVFTPVTDPSIVLDPPATEPAAEDKKPRKPPVARQKLTLALRAPAGTLDVTISAGADGSAPKDLSAVLDACTPEVRGEHTAALLEQARQGARAYIPRLGELKAFEARKDGSRRRVPAWLPVSDKRVLELFGISTETAYRGEGGTLLLGTPLIVAAARAARLVICGPIREVHAQQRAAGLFGEEVEA